MGSSSGINTAVNAGLPDITGSMIYIAGPKNGYWANFAYAANENGCFGSEEAPGEQFLLADVTYPKEIIPRITLFRASRSNSVYGASTTVQPPALKVAVLIKHD